VDIPKHPNSNANVLSALAAQLINDFQLAISSNDTIRHTAPTTIDIMFLFFILFLVLNYFCKLK
jgi:hypothetical protein